MADPLLYTAARFEAITALTALGWLLLACKPDKSPYTKAGFKSATLDREQLSRSIAKHGDALLGARTGQESGFFVIDIDVDEPKGIDGFAWLNEQIKRHGSFPAGPFATTRRGGRHLYFAYPEDRVVKSTAGKLARGVDVRGDGGYVIVPPSQSGGGRWEWDAPPTEHPLPDAPEWLLALVCELPPKNELLELDESSPPTGDDLTLAAEEIERQLAKVRDAREGTRNATLNAVAFFFGKLVGAGVANEADIFRRLSEAAGQAGLGEQEAGRTIRSGVNAGKRRPWRPRAASPRLADINREYFFSTEGKTGLIFREEVDPLSGNRTLGRLYVSAFKESFSNRHIGSGDNRISLGVGWMNWGSRRQYDKVVFVPGRKLPDNLYNQWHGFAVEPVEGDCGKILGLMQAVICGGDPANFEYLQRWCARAAQQPWRQGEVAVVLRGRKGVGKSYFAGHLGELFGDHYVTMADSRHLVGNFNAHLETAIVVFADEAFWAGDKQGEGVLKTLITEPHIRVERKGIDSKSAPNYAHLIMASNSDWVVPASHDERRYFVLDVSEHHREDHDYFAAIEREWETGGREAFLYHLLTIDLSGFNVRRVPQTEALRDQKLLSLPTVDRWFYGMLRAGRNDSGPADNHSNDRTQWPEWVQTEFLWNAYSESCQHERARPGSLVAFGMRFKTLLPPSARRQQRGSPRLWGYEFPPLDECRRHFEKLVGTPIDWGDDSSKSPPPPKTDF
jgi:hypothetical protein